MLELDHVSKSYDSGGPARVDVLKDVSLQIAAAESLAIVGPSGSGKSTLLNIIGTLDQPTSGEVVLDGQNIRELKPKEIAVLRNQKIGFIFQLHHLLPQCTILENVLIPTLASASKNRGAQAEQRAERLLDRVGLKPRMLHRPGQLSGGERQRAAVVRALINQPKLLLADEPTGALDRASAENLRDLLVELNREEGVALIVVTHSLDLARGMSRTFEMSDGQLIESETR
jgi:ABC-type lipoprotein export system ATPase subunit